MHQRFYSLDVFRGATVALMILVNNPGSWSYIYPPLAHAPWHGCTPTDLVFPFFLFAVGNALAFVMPSLEQKPSAFFWKKVTKRTLLIFGIGLFLNWSPFVKWQDEQLVWKTWDNIRIMGVLQRIALCYFFAAIIAYYTKIRGSFLLSVIILLGYWALTLLASNHPNPYSLAGFFGTAVDQYLLGSNHLYKGEGIPFDPEGLTSTLPAITQVILGYLVGHYIIQKGKTYEMLSHLLIIGLVCIGTGLIWHESFPMNKKLWTSSYVLYTTGLAICTLGLLMFWIEMKHQKNKLFAFFDVFGKNPLFIFVLSGFLPRVLALFRWVDHVDDSGKPIYTSALPWFYQHICKPISTDLRNGSLLYAICMIVFYWLIVYLLDKKKIYIKV